ncbi:Helix-loop-helix protein 25 [Caenorhabditis elegans]|uniref:Helix-loop-helix protein 25 n=1 Tax=Caenorhabditis elegans TaxID=6239 RepID=HLH25_CAEEL|nr:Helix-loop-helix protein 25 [Caenorhabditis elegans]Q18054.2 RecName: Full=Helix-loop-helix protein 25 [Caenorhabditis elegans]CCD64851.1 Helix-loop-helix protein 25 [Caenorhabditis elegans]|eukprot:NP_495063.2 Helix Loop Helix [Caenorhabditis elegans]
MPKVIQSSMSDYRSVPYNQTPKSASERKRRNITNELINECKTIVQKSEEEHISQEVVLFRIVKLVTGVNLESNFSSNDLSESTRRKFDTESERRKVKTEREKIRRKKQDDCYAELKFFILNKQMGSYEQRLKLERITILEIIIDYIKHNSDLLYPETIPQILPLLAGKSTATCENKENEKPKTRMEVKDLFPRLTFQEVQESPTSTSPLLTFPCIPMIPTTQFNVLSNYNTVPSIFSAPLRFILPSLQILTPETSDEEENEETLDIIN